ncbi:hypothetical protein HYN59_02675 [Flavobacterium album]|uniref:Uncharacterized protein n=1 Tax=Flavobacterium album TaxID=2175091 RepID=A0A2S1QUI0_9FLAO|nr:hypothetical protein [Flavobacterium album]AWH84080.1 hypothetical protein HYN59_02675 [Flavobacterium album]
MDIAAKKLELLDWVMHLRDNAMFEKLLALKAETDQEIVAYTVSGEPLTLEQYKAKIDKGMRDIQEGRYMTHEELLKEMETW